ncbi:hypothetical protein HK097_006623 [Rhizophlyctis rosea]|uniref:BHLH domain-containing protein n=1 Tax=Rhizophlyctis rosea TaxID=64517 RepID=A0AAD5SCL0_9FUNG|nr:hypothetical protein HK097_006623 [Rhizophlyctis rosea]
MNSPTALHESYILPSPIVIKQEHPSSPPALPTSPLTARPTTSSTSTKREKELLRKVSHSAIERRRRERINDKIMQLRNLVPTCAKQENMHKLNILQNAIDYIRHLQLQLDAKPGSAMPLQQQQSGLTTPISPEQSPDSTILQSPYSSPSPPQLHLPPPLRQPSYHQLPSIAQQIPASPTFSIKSDASSRPPSSPLRLPATGVHLDHPDEVARGLLMLRECGGSDGRRQGATSQAQSSPMSVGSLLC